MDIRELRIGDKVTYLDRIVTIRTIYDTGHVEFLMKDGDHCFVFTVGINGVDPIVLTDELLDKIGFKYSNGIFEVKNFKYNLFTSQVHSERCHKSGIIYLHQLQHELYDAGIELKIEL